MPVDMPRILLIAEESDLRRSVQFALDAEGYAVTARAGLTPPEPARHFDCTIIDHPTADADPTALAFFAAHAPIVLLADALTHPLAPHATRTVLKPLLGPALSAAIREAIGKVRRA
jgi:CheY-like chemotaxis protein